MSFKNLILFYASIILDTKHPYSLLGEPTYGFFITYKFMKQNTDRKVSSNMPRFLKALPFIKTLGVYNREKLQSDLVAGLTVAIMALPQSMAYALIAGVNPKYGLYAAIIPTVIASLFGSSQFLIAGPTNAISMVVASTMASVAIGGMVVDQLPEEQKIALVFLLAFMVGVIQLVMGIAKFGGLTNFISHSVVIGFTSGAGILITVNQLKNFLGINIGKHSEFFEVLRHTVLHIGETNTIAFGLGLFTVIFILFSRKISTKIPGPLLSMIIAAAAAYFFNVEAQGVKLIGDIPRSLPPLSSFPLTLETIQHLFPAALAIAILGVVEALSIAKSIASSSGERINGNQEFIAQGASNISAGFFSGIPGSGSFTRSAANFNAGAKTRFSGIFSGIFVLITIIIFAPFARYIPLSSLAGIIMVVAYTMVDKKAFALSFKATRADRLVLLVTMLATLFLELEMAVYVGVLLSVLLFLRKVSHPQVFKMASRERGGKLYPLVGEMNFCPQLSIYQIEGPLFFGAINELEDRLRVFKKLNEKIVIIRMKQVHTIDASGVHALEKFLKERDQKKGQLIFTGVNEAVKKVFMLSGIIEHIRPENIIDSTNEAVAFAFEKYIQRGICSGCRSRVFTECPGTDGANIKIGNPR